LTTQSTTLFVVLSNTSVKNTRQGLDCTVSYHVDMDQFRERLVSKTEVLKNGGDPRQYDSFVSLVIHEGLFGMLADVIEKAKSGPELVHFEPSRYILTRNTQTFSRPLMAP